MKRKDVDDDRVLPAAFASSLMEWRCWTEWDRSTDGAARPEQSCHHATVVWYDIAFRRSQQTRMLVKRHNHRTGSTFVRLLACSLAYVWTWSMCLCFWLGNAIMDWSTSQNRSDVALCSAKKAGRIELWISSMVGWHSNLKTKVGELNKRNNRCRLSFYKSPGCQSVIKMIRPPIPSSNTHTHRYLLLMGITRVELSKFK